MCRLKKSNVCRHNLDRGLPLARCAELAEYLLEGIKTNIDRRGYWGACVITSTVTLHKRYKILLGIRDAPEISCKKHTFRAGGYATWHASPGTQLDVRIFFFLSGWETAK
jgi:hypothetical protein